MLITEAQFRTLVWSHGAVVASDDHRTQDRLYNLELTDAVIAAVALRHVDLSGAIFARCSFADLTLTGCHLRNVRFYDCRFHNAFLSRCNLSKSEWNGSVLHASTYDQCDLSRSELGPVDLTEVTFFDCELKGSTLDDRPISYLEKVSTSYKLTFEFGRPSPDS